MCFNPILDQNPLLLGRVHTFCFAILLPLLLGWVQWWRFLEVGSRLQHGEHGLGTPRALRGVCKHDFNQLDKKLLELWMVSIFTLYLFTVQPVFNCWLSGLHFELWLNMHFVFNRAKILLNYCSGNIFNLPNNLF